MRMKAFLLAAVFGLFTQTTFAEIYPHYPTPHYGVGKHAKLVHRGEYLAKMGDCIACHTGLDGKQPFAGGRPMFTPFGTFFSPNITPDNKTGIGHWTFAQFVKVMHDGIRPNGSNSYPVFPYLWFTKVKTADLKAVWTYLQALPPINKQNKSPYVQPPFRWRWVQTFWKMMYFDEHKGVFHYDKNHSPVWNRGAYLVEGLGHCGMCHTPINFMGIPKHDLALTGSSVSGMLAPDITGRGVAGKASIAELVSVFKQGKLVGGGKLGGGMEEAYKDSLQYLNHKDMVAIATYLHSFKSESAPKKVTLGGSPMNIGNKLYHATCYACHANGSGGAPKFGDHTEWAKRMKKGMDVLYKNAIDGFRGMPAKGTCMSCTDQEVKDAVLYMVKDSMKSAVKKPVGKPYPALTLADGKSIYMKHCSVCHESGMNGAPIVGNKADWAPRILQGVPMLFQHALNGFKQMPARGGCQKCSGAALKAAVIYMIQTSRRSGDYRLWLKN